MSRKSKEETPKLSLVPTAAEIDTLYQRPLAEFTSARNELAKRAGGKSDASITSLEKPSLPAWGVNQLYWRDRALYDALIAASDGVRQAHRALLAGQTADVAASERGHREAIRAALERVKAILSGAGEAATPATMTAVSETLSALPAGVTPGRLTRPLKPTGFEALTGVSPRPSSSSARAATKPTLVKPAVDPAAAAKEAAAAREAAKEQAKEKERRAADVKKARAALDKAQAAVARAEKDVADCERALSEARRTRDRLQVEAQLAFNEHQHAVRRARE